MQPSTQGQDTIVVNQAKVTGTCIVRRPQGTVVGYNIETIATKTFRNNIDTPEQQQQQQEVKWSVVRTEYDLESFNNQIIDALCRGNSNASAEIKSALESKLAFPIQPYSTGLELLPVVALGGSMMFLTYGHNMDLGVAFLISIVISSVAFLAVLAFGFAKLPLTWSAPKRIEPLNQYFDRVLKMEGVSSSTATVSLLQEPLRPDWPARVGPIDLALHDLPHDSAATEWWYYNAHLDVPNVPGASKKTRKVSVFVCFFRILKHVDDRGNKIYAHALTWAMIDPENENAKQQYVSDVLLEKDTPQIVRDILKEEIKVKGESFFRRALLEVLEKGNLPKPDRMFSTEPRVAGDALDINYEAASLEKDAMGRYVVKAKNGDTFLSLTFDPLKPAIRHGDHGVVAGHSGDEMFYYFIPRLSVVGEIGFVDGKDKIVRTALVSGEGWYDHEFGGMYRKDKEAKERTNYAWNWVSAQLDDGSELTAAALFDAEKFDENKKEVMLELKAVLISKEGIRTQYDGALDGITFDSLPGHWNSVRTFKAYPTSYKLQIPAIGMDLTFTATIPDQEFMTLISKPSFWEGRVDVVGTIGKNKVKGVGFCERNGFDPNLTVGKFFKGVNEEVLKSVAAMYPRNPTKEEAVALVATEDTAYYVDDVPLDILGDTLIAPVRTVADRGGKSWRSYAALATIDVVGGDSRGFVQWIAMPEFLHVGSLLIDDIQDDSLTRRGGPCAHLVHGVPLTINAGTAAYFMVERLLSAPHLSKAELLECYQLYFGALRGGHAGQALDIHGNDYLMDAVVETGNAEVLEKRILAIHMLKTAVPAGTLARMGSLVGGGTKDQIEAVGKYFEGVGLAFQIQDDVLNLRGIYSKGSDKMKKGTMLKTLGEDIADGKVTMPVCKYMALEKSKEERLKTWNLIKSKPKDQLIINDVIAALEKVGAIDACVDQANTLVEDAWKKLDPVVPDSFPKMMLRSFGWYVNEQGMLWCLVPVLDVVDAR